MIKLMHGKIDKVLLVSALLIVLMGMAFVYSATWDRPVSTSLFDPIFIKQCIWALVGIVVLFAVTNTDYLKVLDFAYIFYFLNLCFLVFLLFFGGTRYGARRWISLGPFSFQPSEFVKITVILALASFLGDRREKMKSFQNFAGALLIVLPAVLLIFLQPDLGTSLVFFPIVFSVLYICGAQIKYIIGTMVLGLASLPVLWHLLKDYQKSRLMVFINPDLDPLGAGYTIIQSKIAVGSGGFFGKGWLGGTQSHLKFLPERHTDFIFSVIGEEWGFVGATFVICMYALLLARGIKIISSSDDIYGRAISTGIVTLIAFQTIVNISMTIGIMPVVGLPLPAISYGGSNTIMFLVNVGLLLSISRRAKR